MKINLDPHNKAIEMYDTIDDEAKQIWAIYSLLGYKAYFVGGCVRDFFLNKIPKDYDICTDAKPEDAHKVAEKINIFDNDYSCKVVDTGSKYGTMTLIVTNEKTNSSKSYEVTTMREDGEYEDGRRPESVTFTNDIVTDLSRRDFTINAIALDPSMCEFIDPFNGIEDIKAKRIKCVGHAPTRFKEDALRMLRAFRLSVQLKFDISHTTAHAIMLCLEYLQNVSKERIRDEINKIVMNDPPHVAYLYNGEFKENDIDNIYIIQEGKRFDDNISKYGGDDLVSRLSTIVVSKTNADGGYEETLKKFKYTNKEINDVKQLVGMVTEEFEGCIRLDMKFPPVNYYAEDDTAKQHVKRILKKSDEKQARRFAFVLANMCDNLFEANKILCSINSITNEIIENKECYNIGMLDINGYILKNNIPDIQGVEIGYILEVLCQMVIAGRIENNMIDLLDLALCIHDNY